MAKFRDLVTTNKDYAAAQKELNNQITEMKANLASLGISVDTQAERALVSRDGLCSPCALCFGDGRESLRVSLVTLLWH